MSANMKAAGIKYGKGGPKSKDYVGNPMGYFNDKAKYGREQMMKEMGGAQDDGFNAYTKMEKGGKVMVSKTKRRAKDDAWVSSDDIKTKMVNKNRAKRMNKRGWKTHQKY